MGFNDLSTGIKTVTTVKKFLVKKDTDNVPNLISQLKYFIVN